MTKIRQYAWVVFNRERISKEIYNEYYKEDFENENGSLKHFVFLGESPQAKGHCFIADIQTGLVSGLHHTEDFREAKEDEYSFTFEIPIDEDE